MFFVVFPGWSKSLKYKWSTDLACINIDWALLSLRLSWCSSDDDDDDDDDDEDDDDNDDDVLADRLLEVCFWFKSPPMSLKVHNFLKVFGRSK